MLGKETLNFHLCTHTDEDSSGRPSLEVILFQLYLPFPRTRQRNLRLNLDFVLDIDSIDITQQPYGHHSAPTILFNFHLKLPESVSTYQISKLPHERISSV